MGEIPPKTRVRPGRSSAIAFAAERTIAANMAQSSSM